MGARTTGGQIDSEPRASGRNSPAPSACTLASAAPSPSTTPLTERAPTTPSTVPSQPPRSHIESVFLVVMENQGWSNIEGNPAAPYINEILLPMGSHAEQYFNPS